MRISPGGPTGPTSGGDVSNGLCLAHDKAFEVGHYRLDSDYCVWTTEEKVEGSPWAQEHILPYVGEPIKPADTPPHPEALQAHWERLEFSID